MKKYMNIKKKIGSISLENKISVIGHILTVISLLLVYFTLREMQIARNQSYRPDIMIDSHEISLQWKNKYDFSDLASRDVSSKEQYSKEYLNAYNIGTGVAKNIQFEWDDSNISNIAKCINENSNGEYSISINKNQTIQIKTDKVTSGISIYPDTKNEKNFLSSDVKEPFKLEIPHSYLILYKIIYMSQIKEVPTVSLIIKFEDVQGKEYKKTVNLYFKQEVLSAKKGARPNDYNGNARLTLSAGN